MSQTSSGSQLPSNVAQIVYIVTCYQNIVGVYSKFEDAAQVAQVNIQKGRVSDIITKVVQ